MASVKYKNDSEDACWKPHEEVTVEAMIAMILVAAMFLMVGNVCFAAANCRTPNNAYITLKKSGKHSATATVSGIAKCSGQSSYENSVTVRVIVKVGVRPDNSIREYDETGAAKHNVSGTGKTQTVTPVAHYLIGARGSWSAKCEICGKRNNGTIPYRNESIVLHHPPEYIEEMTACLERISTLPFVQSLFLQSCSYLR